MSSESIVMIDEGSFRGNSTQLNVGRNFLEIEPPEGGK